MLAAGNYIEVMKDLVAADMPMTTAFINRYSPFSINQDILLEHWAEGKSDLFQLLGEQLIYEKDIEFALDGEMGYTSLFTKHYESLYPFWSFGVDWSRIYNYIDRGESDKVPPFLLEVLDVSVKLLSARDAHSLQLAIDTCLSSTAIFNNRVRPHQDLTLNGDRYRIPSGMKPMRALRQVLSRYGLHLFPSFDKFRTDMAQLKSEAYFKGKIAFSIHPLDYLTLSDNANGWSSCMSWRGGDNRKGVLSMMNSSNTIVVYLKSSKPMKVIDSDWNSKIWRVLVTVTDDFILTGKSYPYGNDALTYMVLDMVKDLAEKNLGWTYNSGPEQYLDMAADMVEEKGSSWVATNYYYNDFSVGDLDYEEYDEYKDAERIFYGGGACYKNTLVRAEDECAKTYTLDGSLYCLSCGKEFSRSSGWCDKEIFCKECL